MEGNLSQCCQYKASQRNFFVVFLCLSVLNVAKIFINFIENIVLNFIRDLSVGTTSNYRDDTDSTFI